MTLQCRLHDNACGFEEDSHECYRTLGLHTSAARAAAAFGSSSDGAPLDPRVRPGEFEEVVGACAGTFAVEFWVGGVAPRVRPGLLKASPEDEEVLPKQLPIL